MKYCLFCKAENLSCGTISTKEGWSRSQECIEREKFIIAGKPIHRASAGVWERPGEIGPNGCYPDPADFG